MPVARRDVVAVVALAVRVGRRSAEVAVVAVQVVRRRARVAPVVVAGDRARPRLDRRITPRRRGVAVREVGGGAARVDVVADGEDVAVDALDDVAGRRVLGDRARGDVADPDEDGVGARDGVEGPGRAGRRVRAVADGRIPLERLAGAEARPGRGVVRARGDAGVLGDLREVAARQRTPEEGDRQRVGVRIGDADVERRREADPRARRLPARSASARPARRCPRGERSRAPRSGAAIAAPVLLLPEWSARLLPAAVVQVPDTEQTGLRRRDLGVLGRLDLRQRARRVPDPHLVDHTGEESGSGARRRSRRCRPR